MAVPTYTTDLVDIADLDSSGGTAVEPLTLYTAGRSPVEDDEDMPIQGTLHASLTFNTVGDGGILVPGTTFTYSAGDYIFGWVKWTAPSTINTYANGGLSILLGSSASVFNVYWVSGSDRAPNPYGGWQNIAILPTSTPDENAGTPTAYHYVGCGAKCIKKVSKGNPLAFDAFRYGRGEIRVAGGQSGNYATFAGMAAANDASLAKWGLFQEIDGGYKSKGVIVLGYGAVCEFTDSDKSIVIDNSEWVSANFDRYELRNASSVVNWTNITITALGTTSRGQFEMIDNCTLNDTGGVFTGMDTFIYQSNATITGRTWRGCNRLTQGGATITNCLITKSTDTISLVVSNLNLVTGSTFESDGSNHAVDLGTIASNITLEWSNTTSDYASSDGSSGNEVVKVHVNAGVTLTITLDGVAAPSVYNTGTGTVYIPLATYSLSFTGIPSGVEYRLRQGSYSLQHEQDVTSGTTSAFSYEYSNDFPVTVSFTGSGIIEAQTFDIVLSDTDQIIPVVFKPDPSYIA